MTTPLTSCSTVAASSELLPPNIDASLLPAPPGSPRNLRSTPTPLLERSDRHPRCVSVCFFPNRFPSTLVGLV